MASPPPSLGPDGKTLGARIAALRAAKDMSAKQLADEAVVAPNTVYAAEADETNPSPRTLEKLALVLKVPRHFLETGQWPTDEGFARPPLPRLPDVLREQHELRDHEIEAVVAVVEAFKISRVSQAEAADSMQQTRPEEAESTGFVRFIEQIAQQREREHQASEQAETQDVGPEFELGDAAYYDDPQALKESERDDPGAEGV